MRFFILFLMLGSSIAAANNNGMTIKIQGVQAQKLYHALTGVQEDGAAGHIYKQGKSVLCIRTNADMDDAHGKLIPPEDPRRYVCKMHFDNKGLATAVNE